METDVAMQVTKLAIAPFYVIWLVLGLKKVGLEYGWTASFVVGPGIVTALCCTVFYFFLRMAIVWAGP